MAAEIVQPKLNYKHDPGVGCVKAKNAGSCFKVFFVVLEYSFASLSYLVVQVVWHAWSQVLAHTVASLPFSVMPRRSEAETDEANFCQYVYVTKLFVKERPADFFGLAEMEDVYECTRNAILWCYCRLAQI